MCVGQLRLMKTDAEIKLENWVVTEWGLDRQLVSIDPNGNHSQDQVSMIILLYEYIYHYVSISLYENLPLYKPRTRTQGIFIFFFF